MIPVFEQRKELIGRSKYSQVLRYSVAHGRVLDIGCGIGEVLDVFRDGGWECEAIEVNPGAVQWLRNRTLKVFVGSFDAYVPETQFDVVMAWGVVEHVVDPRAFLRKAYELLRPGGVFVSEVPCGQSLTVDFCRASGLDPQRIVLGEQHIILYSIPAYERIHAEAGFEKIHVQTNGLDVETVLKITGETLSDDVMKAFQGCVDAGGRGDLLRGFWRRVQPA
jgi:SAM-dependent methyltransferase